VSDEVEMTQNDGERIPVIRQATATPEQAAVAEHIMAVRGRPGAPVVATFGALLHSPEGTRVVAAVGEFCRFGSSIPDDMREASILAVAHALGADYERTHHEAIARRIGLDDTQLAALRDGVLTAPPLEESVALAARLAREVAVSGGEAAQLVAESRAALGDASTVELVITAAYYAMLADIQRVLGISVDQDP
jgi:4-carboxymuconolactone decarboxylase